LGKITADPTPKSPAFPFIDNSFAEKHQNVNQGRLCNSLIFHVENLSSAYLFDCAGLVCFIFVGQNQAADLRIRGWSASGSVWKQPWMET